MRGDATPVVMDQSVIRPKEPVQLLDKLVVSDTIAKSSDGVACQAFRKFGLFVFVDSTGAPTTIQFKVEFLDRWSGQWHLHAQGPFASLFYEDGDTASGLYECFVGDCLGRAMRVTVVGVGTTGSAYFTVSAAAEFWN